MLFYIFCYCHAKGTIFANTTVYGAMILTDPAIADVLGNDFHRIPQGVKGSPRDNALLRVEYGTNVSKALPFDG